MKKAGPLFLCRVCAATLVCAIFATYTISADAETTDAIQSAVSFSASRSSASSVAKADVTPSRICIDTPRDSSLKMSGEKMQVCGWALGSGGVRSASILIDGKSVTTVSVNGSRPDVAKVYPSYTNAATSGYAATVSISSLTFGTHTLTVRTTLNNGAAGAQASVTFNKQAPRLMLDSPVNNSDSSNGFFLVAGWALTYTGQTSVDVYLDNQKMATVQANRARADVGRAYPTYPSSAASGYSYTLYISTAGTHTISVRSISDGTTVSRTVTVRTSVKASHIALDTVKNNTYVSNSQLYVAGWALGESGAKSVDIQVDGKTIETVPVNGSRPDVARAYPGYTGNESSGYKGTVDISNLAFGTHTLTIRAKLNNGQAGAQTSVTFNKQASRLTVDFPRNGVEVDGSDVTVCGWALSYSGNPRVSISLDGVQYAQVTATGSRPDVARAYPTYAYAAHSGYSCLLKNVTGGRHAVTVSVTSDNGNVTTVIVSFIVPGYTDVEYKTFHTTLEKLAAYNGVDSSTIDPDALFNNKVSKYELMSLYNIDGITVDDINTMLQNCGVLAGQGQAVIDAAKAYDVNPVYLAAHMRIETGNGTSKLAKGIYVAAGTYTDCYGKKMVVETSGVYYNLLGIHAYDKDPTANGSEYAASQGWNSVPTAIAGATQWVSEHYIHNSKLGSSNYDQMTLYEMKWDPEGTARHNAKSGYEYATDPDWAFGISNIMAQYSSIFIGKDITFYIPKFDG